MSKNAITVKEGERLKLFMDRYGIPQQEVADLIGKDRTIVTKYLSGTVKIPIETLKKLHLKYSLSYSWFFHGTGTPKVNETAEKKSSLLNQLDIMATLSVLMEKAEAQDNLLRKLVADFYAHKNESH